MNVKCTLNARTVYIVDISPSQKSGYFILSYVDSGDILRFTEISIADGTIIGTSVTEIDGISI